MQIGWERREQELRLTWRETGGPPVEPPTRRGFGSRLLEASLRDLGGRTSLAYAAEGVTAEFSAPL